MDRDFENGTVKDNYPYISHSSEQEPESSQRFRMEIVLPGEVTALTLEEMEDYIKYFKDPEIPSLEYMDNNNLFREDFHPSNFLDTALYNKLEIYQEEESGVPDYPILLNINKSELDEILTNLPTNFKEGNVVDIILPINIETQIKMYEEEKQKILLDNEISIQSNKENFDKAMNIIETKKLATVLDKATCNMIDNKVETKPSIFSRLRKIFK